MSETTLVAGRPLTGEIPHRGRSKQVEQLPIEGWVAKLDALFDFGIVEAIRWDQYTPSWNDGDPCEFGVGEIGIRLVGWDEDEQEYPESLGYGDLEGADEDCGGNGFIHDYYVRDKFPELAEVFKANFDWNSQRAFYHALEDAFGDPAQVTATREGFSVEYYEAGY